MHGRMQFAAWIILALSLGFLGVKCPGIPQTEEITISVVTEEYFELVFEARGSINVESDTETIDVDELREELEELGVDLSAVDTIRVSAVEYGVVAYNEGPTDRQIVDGRVTVTRTDTGESALLVDDLDVMVHPLLGALVPAPIDPAGIAFINDLLEDVLAALRGSGPSEFQVVGAASGVSEPEERTTNFDWRVRVYYHVSGGLPIEVPDF